MLLSNWENLKTYGKKKKENFFHNDAIKFNKKNTKTCRCYTDHLVHSSYYCLLKLAMMNSSVFFVGFDEKF